MTNWWLGMFSEFVGTAFLILLGNGVCAATSFKRMGANQPGKWVAIALGWGFAVFIGAIISSAMYGGGYLNPAVLIMNAITATNGVSSGVFYNGIATVGSVGGGIAATFFIILVFEALGAIAGQLVLNFINFKFIKDKENDLATIRGTHCTAAAYKNKAERAWVFNLSYEFIGTIVLCVAILAIGLVNGTDLNVGALGTIPVTFVIMSIGLSLGSATGYAINPFRDLMPRIVFAGFVNFFRKEDKVAQICDWGYSWVPVVGPMLAGVVCGCFGLINI